MLLSLNVFLGRSSVSSCAGRLDVSSVTLIGHHLRMCCCKSCILFMTTPHSIHDIYRWFRESVMEGSIVGRSSFLTIVVERSVISLFSF